MTQAPEVAAVPDEKIPKKEPRYPDYGTFWQWEPTDAFLTEMGLYDNTSYAANLVYIHAERGAEPQVLLVRQNPDDPEKFSQIKGGSKRRQDGWKTMVGRFYPFRYLNDDGSGSLDHHLLDTAIEENWEETGTDFREVDDVILKSLKNAPVAEYRGKSKRAGSDHHIDRVHFWVTPHLFPPDEKVWKKQIELTDVRFFPLFELPRQYENGMGAHMIFTHARRIVEFLEHPQSADIRWMSGIPDDAGERIRARFPEFKISR